jgi:hypothetical protein
MNQVRPSLVRAVTIGDDVGGPDTGTFTPELNYPERLMVFGLCPCTQALNLNNLCS